MAMTWLPVPLPPRKGGGKEEVPCGRRYLIGRKATGKPRKRSLLD
jgi:hypothetical protein